jgi:para-aminobenzoate synthetase / 4-amino-4-deoxychorismate lyase
MGTVLSTPRAALGVFETLLVAAGAPVELGAHLDRLAASAGALYGAELPEGLARRMGERARGLPLGRLRATLVPGAGGLAATLAAQPLDPASLFPSWERGAELSSLRHDGGLGFHKWADRSPLSPAPAETVPLLLDRGDEVLEAGRASVFIATEGRLATPPLDGRILPGIARAGAIAAAAEAGIGVEERALRRDDLLAADEVFLTGSVRGVEPARSLDGGPLAAGTELSRRVGAGLRRRWKL